MAAPPQLDAYFASNSDSAHYVAVAPRTRANRSRRTAALRRCSISWRQRAPDRVAFAAQHFDGSFTALSSPDTSPNPPNATIRHRLSRLRRPSSVVPVPHDPSPQAAFSRTSRTAHNRLVAAAALRVSYLDRTGAPIAVPSWARERHGLSRYSPYLVPPREDVEAARQPRGHRASLSRSYRSIGLRSFRPGDRRPLPRRRRRPSSFDDGPPPSSSDDGHRADCAELDAWCPSSDFEAAERARVFANRKAVKKARNETAAKKAREHQQRMLAMARMREQRALGEEAVDIDVDHIEVDVIPAPCPGIQLDATIVDLTALPNSSKPALLQQRQTSEPELENGVQPDTVLSKQSGQEHELRETPNKESNDEIEPVPALATAPTPKPEKKDDILANLFNNAKNNLSSFFSEPSPSLVPKPKPAFAARTPPTRMPRKRTPGACASAAANHIIVIPDSPEPEPLTPFERDRRLAAAFSAKPQRAKVSSKRRHRKAIKIDPEDEIQPKHQTSDEDSVEEVRRNDKPLGKDNIGYALLKKMGYSHRLGRLENGRLEPIQATRKASRMGLGRVAPVEGRVDKRAIAGTTRKNVSKTASADVMEVVVDEVRPCEDEIEKVDKESPTNGMNIGKADKEDREGSGQDIDKTTNDPRSRVKDRAVQRDPDGLHRGPITASAAAGPERDLDSEDELETEVEDDGVDNGRRAIVIDFDVLVCNSKERRLAAFKVLVRDPMFKGVKEEHGTNGLLDVDDILLNSARELNDLDMVALLLRKAGSESTDAMVLPLMKVLDEAFKAGELPERNMNLLNTITSCARRWRHVEFAFYTRSSRERFRNEVKFFKHALPDRRITTIGIGHETDYWPYESSWSELCASTGVRARHIMLVLNDSGEGIHSGEVMGALLGARSIVLSRSQDGKNVDSNDIVHRQHVVLGYQTMSITGEELLGRCLQQSVRLERRRRVLALFPEDNLWYSATVMFRHDACPGEDDGFSYVRFHSYGNSAWVKNGTIEPLPRKLFRLMRAAGFNGLLEPEDAANATALI